METLKMKFEELKTVAQTDEKYINAILDYVEDIFKSRLGSQTDIRTENISLWKESTKNIILEMSEDYKARTGEKGPLSSIVEFWGYGRTSLVFRVGDNVVKLGKTSTNIMKFPLHNYPFTLTTYFRECYEVTENSCYTIDVSPLVNISNLENFDLYILYEKLRKIGYIWNDPAIKNIGRVVGKQSCRIHGTNYEPPKDQNIGDVIIIDKEDFAYVGEITSDAVIADLEYKAYNGKVYNFEMRYLKENFPERKF